MSNLVTAVTLPTKRLFLLPALACTTLLAHYTATILLMASPTNAESSLGDILPLLLLVFLQQLLLHIHYRHTHGIPIMDTLISYSAGNLLSRTIIWRVSSIASPYASILRTSSSKWSRWLTMSPPSSIYETRAIDVSVPLDSEGLSCCSSRVVFFTLPSQ